MVQIGYWGNRPFAGGGSKRKKLPGLPRRRALLRIRRDDSELSNDAIGDARRWFGLANHLARQCV
ncbi:MAG: hypothetical protein DCC49_02250 [Acidobacteria bacterium]|nr:MAG: hypothetical protein DCC49_02250 [Acidobacteriota bacterium]